MLRNKVLMQLLLLMFITLGVFTASYYFILQHYEQLEIRGLELNRNRVLNALEQEIARLDDINREWADAGLVYSTLHDGAMVFFREMVMEVLSGSFNVSEAAVFDTQGNLMLARTA